MIRDNKVRNKKIHFSPGYLVKTLCNRDNDGSIEWTNKNVGDVTCYICRTKIINVTMPHKTDLVKFLRSRANIARRDRQYDDANIFTKAADRLQALEALFIAKMNNDVEPEVIVNLVKEAEENPDNFNIGFAIDSGLYPD